MALYYRWLLTEGFNTLIYYYVQLWLSDPSWLGSFSPAIKICWAKVGGTLARFVGSRLGEHWQYWAKVGPKLAQEILLAGYLQ